MKLPIKDIKHIKSLERLGLNSNGMDQKSIEAKIELRTDRKGHNTFAVWRTNTVTNPSLHYDYNGIKITAFLNIATGASPKKCWVFHASKEPEPFFIMRKEDFTYVDEATGINYGLTELVQNTIELDVVEDDIFVSEFISHTGSNPGADSDLLNQFYNCARKILIQSTMPGD